MSMASPITYVPNHGRGYVYTVPCRGLIRFLKGYDTNFDYDLLEGCDVVTAGEFHHSNNRLGITVVTYIEGSGFCDEHAYDAFLVLDLDSLLGGFSKSIRTAVSPGRDDD
jgi:hypothetical protein